MKAYVTTGLTVLAGVALFEAALIPAVVVGGAAVLAPRYLPMLRRRLRPARNANTRNGKRQQRSAQVRTAPDRPAAEAPFATLAGLQIGRAIAKTITFRVIVTALDFTTNYVVIGELTTAAGLSTFNTVAGPLLYLGHEGVWNYLGPSEDTPVGVQVRGLTMSRALAKTVTYRTIATIFDFTTNYVVVGDALTAAGLAAFGFVLGPFVYYGHEKVWDYYSSPADTDTEPPPVKLLPAPG
jgi:uncharacterized membrane protein